MSAPIFRSVTALLILVSLSPDVVAAQTIDVGDDRGVDVAALPFVVPNDNRTPGGVLRDGVLAIRLVVDMARWAPEGSGGPAALVAAIAEEGGPPRIPAPLIRVPVGTTVEATIRNALTDSTLLVRGLAARPLQDTTPVRIPPGETRVVRFDADGPGTYVYHMSPGTVDPDLSEREQLAGAIVVDAPGEPTHDRIFVINIWGQATDAEAGYVNVLAINGLSWPHTEPIDATVGDTLRWRIVNASGRNHPMHLHGFYFTVEARGGFDRDTIFAPEHRRLAVTEDLSADHTMRIAWVPERPGNWLFHCHLSFHVLDGARLAPHGAHGIHSADPREHMAGLILGIAVRGSPGWTDPARDEVRRLRLLVQEGPPRGRAPRALGFVLQEADAEPAADSVRIPGPPLVLTRGEPTDIVVVNRLAEATSIHWHGIELESFSDGVAGWSGDTGRLAPAIAPGDSFVARLTLPRAGTFIYHTHLNDIEQLTSGLYGGIVVLQPGQTHDSAHDHLFVAGWDGEEEPARIVVQGDSAGPPLEWVVGVPHRLRFVNIGPAQRIFFEVRRGDALAQWRPLAKDGADLSPHAAVTGPATRRLSVGETFDAELIPAEPGEYTLVVRWPNRALPPIYRRVIRVRE